MKIADLRTEKVIHQMPVCSDTKFEKIGHHIKEETQKTVK